MSVKFTDANGNKSEMNREQFMEFMRTLHEIAQLNKAEKEDKKNA